MAKKFQFKITLQGSKPPIWRRFQVTDDYRLDRFHLVLQITMGWTNSHLHEFDFGGRRFGMHLDDVFDDFNEGEDETKFYIRDLALRKGDRFGYLYDFGDGWAHLIEVEEISDDPLTNPACVKGKGACPPEDCGGIWGYMGIIEIIKNPKHPEYEDWSEWMPEDFDPALFPLEEINEELKSFGEWHRKHPKAKSTPWHMI